MNWTCPYCNRPQTVTTPKNSVRACTLDIDDPSDGLFGVRSVAIGCSNNDCQRTTIIVALVKCSRDRANNIYLTDEVVLRRHLQPEGSAKPQPDYIPQAIRQDYAEACLIRDLSPKASATLSRRCLQGMIRDFCGVSGKTLYGEITALEAAISDGTAPRSVSEESVAALHHIRTVGNIGAHMEADVSHIVDVDPNEAQALIDVIEMLLSEWYVERHNRAVRMAKVREIAQAKAEAKKPSDADGAETAAAPRIDG